MSAGIFNVHIRDGYAAARAGKLATANPWKPETVGGKAWSIGWGLGNLPAPLRWVARLAWGIR